MQPYIAILFKSVVTAAIMLAYYVLALRGKRLHAYNRAYLLATLLASAIVPFLNFHWYTVEAQSAPALINMLQVVDTGLEEEIITTTKSTSFNATQIALIAYATISVLLLASLAYRIVSVIKKKHAHTTTRVDGYNLIHTNLPNAPFSFFNNIFWNENIEISSDAGWHILQHELAHIKQQHTCDRIFTELVLALGWLNPFLWYIRHELAQVHEFLADEHAITDNDTSAFAEMLLAAHYKNAIPPITTAYFHSPVKRRINMLNQNTKTRFAKLRRAIALPVLAIPVFLLSFTTHKEAPAPVVAGNPITLVLDAAHGGNDKGAVSSNNVAEKVLSLKMCKKMAQLAKEYNIQVVLTRNGDQAPTLQQRADMSNKVTEGIFVSLHVDQSTPGNVAGYKVIVSEKNIKYAESKQLASAVAGQFSKAGISMPLTQQGIHVLKANNHPAIAIECGDIDNATDVARIQNDAKLETMCRNILSGITAYANTAKK